MAVLGNGTEYQHALEEGARPKGYLTLQTLVLNIGLVATKDQIRSTA